MNKNPKVDAALSLALSWCAVGSRVTCNPPPTDSDEDYALLMSSNEARQSEMVLVFSRLGFELEGKDYGRDDEEFQSWRLEDYDKKINVNLICMWDVVLFEKFIAATRLCKVLNVMERGKRVLLFRTVMHGKFPEDEDDPLMEEEPS